jgi:hypothetical protein
MLARRRRSRSGEGGCLMAGWIRMGGSAPRSCGRAESGVRLALRRVWLVAAVVVAVTHHAFRI